MILWLLFWTLGALILGWLAERWWCQILQEAEIPQPSQRCSSCLEMLTGWRKSLLFNAMKNKGKCLKCGASSPWLALGFPLGIWLGFWPDRPQEPWQLCQELLLLWSLLLIAAIDWHTMWIDYRIVILTLSLHFTILLLNEPGSVLRAVYGALLGAGGLRDIGYYFPDTDEKNKDLSSVKILEESLRLLKEKNLQPHNIDFVIVCEQPKIQSYVENLKKSLSSILNIGEDCIGVKATTAEGMGIIGEGNGIAVFAIASLENVQ